MSENSDHFAQFEQTCDDMLAHALALNARRKQLGKKYVECPECGENLQVQLIEYSRVPSVWKCRTCKHVWSFEPTVWREQK